VRGGSRRDDLRHDVVIGKVRVLLASGSEEVWLTPLRHTHQASSYHGWVYPPPGAVVVEVTPLLRHAATGQEVHITRAQLGGLTPDEDS
jgi:hypothetical protein